MGSSCFFRICNWILTPQFFKGPFRRLMELFRNHPKTSALSAHVFSKFIVLAKMFSQINCNGYFFLIFKSIVSSQFSQIDKLYQPKKTLSTNVFQTKLINKNVSSKKYTEVTTLKVESRTGGGIFGWFLRASIMGLNDRVSKIHPCFKYCLDIDTSTSDN